MTSSCSMPVGEFVKKLDGCFVERAYNIYLINNNNYKYKIKNKNFSYLTNSELLLSF